MTSIKIKTLEEVSKALSEKLDKELAKVEKHVDAIAKSTPQPKAKKATK